MKLRILLLTLLVTFVAMPIAAQFESGKVYRFINKANTNIAMGATSTTSVYGTAVADNDYSQLWLVETHPSNSSAWSLRSLGNGLYLKPMGTSTKWTFSTNKSSATVLYSIDKNGYYTMNSTTADNGQCMHYATSQGGAIVGWNTSAEATLWTVEEITLSEEELQANWTELDAFNNILTDEFQTACETALENLFTDKACTELKKEFANVEQLEADEDYLLLPETLKDMVKKVYTGDWSEENFDKNKPGWDSEHAKRFRIQNIEPYSVAGEITSWLNINAHINMDNPTGIFGNTRQHVYIFVEGEIKNGAELWAGTLVGHGLLDAYNAGVELHEGLNVIPFHGNGNSIYINYVVHTYLNGRFTYKLSDFDDIKVHIAGGNINGFYNGVGDHLWGEPDDDEDWQYYEDRACLESATLLGKYQILHFCMHETEYDITDSDGNVTGKAREKGMSYYLPNVSVPAGTPSNKKVATMLEAWDRIHMSEFATMGLLSRAQLDSINELYPRYDQNWEKAGGIYDYSEAMYELQDNRDYGEHINHHGVALGNFSGYMSGGWRNCNYHHNTMGSIIGEIATNAGSTWGPAHEIGHQHQKTINVNGLTEVTNNMHANIAVWYMGLGTSRVNGSEGNLEKVNNMYQQGTHYLFHNQNGGSQNLWTQTQMYYKLWLYFHRIGKRTDFYPRLFELCRQYPLSSNALGTYEGIAHTSGTMSMLRFYEKACDAAQVDLTEFFRAYGFFVPLDHELRGDYGNSYYTQTEEEINASIARVKAKGYPENIVPLFINDCAAVVTYSHDGKTMRSYWDNETGNGENAKLGMYTTCMDETVAAEGYLYNIVSGKVTISYDSKSKGAIGFIAYNGDNLLAFSNNYTFTLPGGVTTADIYAVQADGTKVKLLSTAEAGTEEQQRDALAKALSAAQKLLKSTDLDYAGNFYETALEGLQTLYTSAKEEYDNKTQNTYTYGKWAMLLNAEINSLVVDKSAMISLKATNIYVMYNNANKSYVLANYNNALKTATSSQVPTTSDYRRWELVASDEKDVFYLKNVGSGTYIAGLENNENANLAATSTIAATKFVATYNGDGTVSLSKQNDFSASLNRNSDNSVRGYVLSDNASKWLIKLVEDNARPLEEAKLEELTAEAERILDEVEHALEEGVLELSSNLQRCVKNLRKAKENGEAGKEDTDITKYIDALEVAINEINSAYILMPVSSKGGPITWYFLKNLDKNTYATSIATGTGQYANSMTHTAEIDREDRSFWWAFVETGNENEFEIYNGATETYLYTLSNSAAALKIDGASDAGRYVLSADTVNIAITIMEGKKYMNASHKTCGRVTTTKGLWKLERICTEEGSLTGIEEILGDDKVIKGIYDLTGRKIEEITAPGIYIVNGKKVLVK